MSDNIIDLRAYVMKLPKGYEEDAVCPKCQSCEEWAVYLKEKDGKLSVSAMACTSDECGGEETVIEIVDGILV